MEYGDVNRKMLDIISAHRGFLPEMDGWDAWLRSQRNFRAV